MIFFYFFIIKMILKEIAQSVISYTKERNDVLSISFLWE